MRIIVLFLIGCTQLAFSQKNADKNLELGILFLKSGNIEDASYYLNKSNYKVPNKTTCYYLGLVNIQKGNLRAAHSHFSQSHHHDSVDYQLALVQKLEGDFEEASKLFKKCSWSDSYFQKIQCDELSKIQSVHAEIKNLKKINTSFSELSPVQFKSDILFSSNREQLTMKKKELISGEGFYDFYVAEFEGDKIKKTTKFSSTINTSYHDLYPSFNASYDTLFYCHNMVSKTNDGSKINMSKLFRSVKENGKWGKPLNFMLNDSLSSFTHPFIAEEGNFFLFSSNMTGGYGGADLYISFKQDTIWSYPINLGEKINTKGNEVSPVLADEILYFSSNGHLSFGGYDLFSSQLVNGDFQSPENLGSPINSSSNESYISRFDAQKKWLIVSDRKGGFGQEDVYEVSFK